MLFSKRTFITAVWLLAAGQVSVHAAEGVFGPRQDWGLVELDALNEASGLVASRQWPGVYWTHNDSDGDNVVYAMNSSGEHLGEYFLDGIEAQDFEDIAIGGGPIPGLDYLYIGDIGDNAAQHTFRYIYRVLEPFVFPTQEPTSIVLPGTDTIIYLYPDGPRDAETLLVDPLTTDIYVISKRESSVRAYWLPYPQSTTFPSFMTFVGTLPMTLVTGGDISPDGLEIMLKTYNTVRLWCREPGQSIPYVLSTQSTPVYYIPEPQGEALGWHSDGEGYLTVSEEAGGAPAHLYFYPRSEGTGVTASAPAAAVRLDRNAPNPFNPSTVISFQLEASEPIDLTVFDVAGRRVRTLATGAHVAGVHRVVWNGRDERGAAMPSGVYYYRLATETRTMSQRMVMAR